jgi:rubrerythrin
VTVEAAIKTSIEYEKRVRDVYVEARDQAESVGARSFFGLMADEEQRHVEFLERKQREWRGSGAIDADDLKTAVPSRERIEKGIAELEEEVSKEEAGAQMEWLEKAHAVETETSGFYRKVVDELPDDAKPLFKRFIEIEDGHLAIVRAQIDLAGGTGYWMDVREFTLEG